MPIPCLCKSLADKILFFFRGPIDSPLRVSFYAQAATEGVKPVDHISQAIPMLIYSIIM